MQFIYAEELNKIFSVYGHFYDLEIVGQTFRCRSVLEIFSNSQRSALDSTPCAVVVMMNPGSSKPKEKSYTPKKCSVDQLYIRSCEKELVPTRPDNAQYQIMRLMLMNDWKHFRILNLSDLRNGNSGEFAREFQRAALLDPTKPHSLTNENRKRELFDYCSQSPVVIAAWGGAEVLRESAITFLNQFPDVEGIRLDTPWYKYPSPYRKDQKLVWLNEMNDRLKNAGKEVRRSCTEA